MGGGAWAVGRGAWGVGRGRSPASSESARSAAMRCPPLVHPLGLRRRTKPVSKISCSCLKLVGLQPFPQAVGQRRVECLPANAEGMEVHLVTRDHAGSYGTWGRIFVCFGRGPPDSAGIRTFSWSARKVAATRSGVGGLLLVLRQTSTPTPEARRPTIQVFHDLVHNGVGAVAIVIEAEGFVAATQRSMSTAFLLTTMRDCQAKVFKTVESAAHWLMPLVYSESGPHNTQQLAASVARFMETEEAKDSEVKAG